ncbi:hypothetical protein JKF63_06976 [Porcisia hertigi]|uniref:Rad51-like C-terminal domain-containing protein n=1 Tax=Porcisia hertigi TaxID=2761500 RepID=A0A836LJ11_9TRYP|nr:hypothetical protein JKF63_06976 [Porcisia hertigi]
MDTSQLYSLHGVYGGLREATLLDTKIEHNLTCRHGTAKRATVHPPSLTAACDAVDTVCVTDPTVSMPTGSAETLWTNSKAHALRCRIQDDSAFLVTPDAELCARHRTSLAHVWAWRTRLSQQQSLLFVNASGRDALSLRGRPELEREMKTPLEGNARCSLHRPCTAADLLRSGRGPTPPLPLAGNGGDPRGHVSATPSASSKVLSASPTLPFLPTGLRSLDASLMGGLRRGWVIELTGLPNTGKTMLAAAWCRNHLSLARSSGAACHCVWLQSGSALDSAVLSMVHEEENATELPPLSNAVHTACLSSLPDLQRLLDSWRATDTSASPLSSVGLIVLDSITDLVRRSFNYRNDDTLQRHDAMATVLQSLKQLAEEQHAAVLIITQQKPYPMPESGPSCTSYTSRATHEEGSNHLEGHGEARVSGYGTCASGVAGFVGPPASQSNVRAEDVGQLGRLFYHNVNVRLELRTCVPSVIRQPSSRRSSDASNPEANEAAIRLRWQLEVLKSPLSAPFAVALRLRAPPCSTSASDLPCSPGPPLWVEEIDDDSNGEVVLPLAQKTQYEEGLPLLSLDPWDYTDVPSFVYL